MGKKSKSSRVYTDPTERARHMRRVPRLNEDGSESTAIFMSAGDKVVPTLYPKDPANYSTDPKDWVEFKKGQEQQAIEMAKERGEVITLSSDKEAKKFAEGSWKRNQKKYHNNTYEEGK